MLRGAASLLEFERNKDVDQEYGNSGHAYQRPATRCCPESCLAAHYGGILSRQIMAANYRGVTA